MVDSQNSQPESLEPTFNHSGVDIDEDENSIMPDPINVATPVIKVLGSVYQWVRLRIVGRRILIMGQHRAGKTTLYRYYKTGKLYPERSVPRTIGEFNCSPFTTYIGRMKLEIRRVIDTAHLSNIEDAPKVITRTMPDALVIVLDLTIDEKETTTRLKARMHSGIYFRVL